MSWKIFLAGIMQGSLVEKELHQQDYRQHLKAQILKQIPTANVYDPLTDHEASLEYGDQKGRDVFLYHNQLCSQVDAVVAFIPQASMGTAIEMWEAWKSGVAVITISPLSRNWVVKFCSHLVYSDLEAFENALTAGDIERCIAEVRS